MSHRISLKSFPGRPETKTQIAASFRPYVGCETVSGSRSDFCSTQSPKATRRQASSSKDPVTTSFFGPFRPKYVLWGRYAQRTKEWLGSCDAWAIRNPLSATQNLKTAIKANHKGRLCQGPQKLRKLGVRGASTGAQMRRARVSGKGCTVHSMLFLGAGTI